MTTTATVLPFRQRPRPLPASPTLEELAERLLLLAKDLDAIGKPVVAGLLLGAAYTLADEDENDDPFGGGQRQAG